MVSIRGDICIHTADSLCCTAGTNTTLQISYTPIKINLKSNLLKTLYIPLQYISTLFFIFLLITLIKCSHCLKKISMCNRVSLGTLKKYGHLSLCLIRHFRGRIMRKVATGMYLNPLPVKFYLT